jgi:hypothetical protein
MLSSFVFALSLCPRRQQRHRTQKFNFLVERMIQLIGQETALRITRERSTALPDCSIDDFETLLDHRDCIRIELISSLGDDVLQPRDLVTVRDIGWTR